MRAYGRYGDGLRAAPAHQDGKAGPIVMPRTVTS